MIIQNDICKFISIKPALYSYLKSIGFSRTLSSQGCTNYVAEIILSKAANETSQDLKITCIDTTNISVGNIEGMYGLLLNIEDIKHIRDPFIFAKPSSMSLLQ